MNGVRSSLAQYETPFGDAGTPHTLAGNHDHESFPQFTLETDSPFSRTYESISSGKGLTPAGEAYLNFVAELDDPDFQETLYELAHEVEDTWRNKISDEVAMGVNYMPFVRQQASEYFAPLMRETDLMINEVAKHFSGNDFASYSDADLEVYFNSLTFDHAHLTPVQEEFLGKVFNKVKNVVKKGVSLAKKGISAVGKLLPINLVLDKLKALIRPLLDKVLKTAIGKLPKNLQGHAQALAKKFLNLETSDDDLQATNSDPSGMQGIQSEFDHYVAQLLFAPGEAEASSLVMDYEAGHDQTDPDMAYENGSAPGITYQAARQRFIQGLKNLPEGASPAPVIEEFLPAAIIALQPIIKMGISIIGRQKVINFLADLLAKLVSKYVPAEVAKPLAASIIDIGMSVIGFEVKDTDTNQLAYEAIANTIEDTVLHMGQVAESDLQDPEALTLHLLEAFETAAAQNFPPQYIKEALRKSTQRATWIGMPRTTPAPLYKKFSHIYEVSIDPQAAATVSTFRGLPLANFLRDKYGLDTSKTIRAKVHLYEIRKDGSLSTIQKQEKLPGLNARQPKGWVQLLPLTKQAASLLIKEPGLGVDLDLNKLSNRFRVEPGQRFYFLEINDAPLRLPIVENLTHKHVTTSRHQPSPVVANRSADIQGVINFTRSEIRLNYFFSEEDARQVVEKMGRNDVLGAAMTIRQSVKSVLNGMLIKNIHHKVKIIHEALPAMYLEQYDDPQEHFLPLAAIGRMAGKQVISKLVELLIERVSTAAYNAVVGYFKARAVEFKDAQAHPQDGVTIQLTWNQVPGMSSIRAVINAVKGKVSIGDITTIGIPSLPTPIVKSVAGKQFD